MTNGVTAKLSSKWAGEQQARISQLARGAFWNVFFMKIEMKKCVHIVREFMFLFAL